ncbi:hypothetical protein PQY04_000987 [Salmonella enterica]|uniref:Uncharacterized protein n=1 Tax=Salmonella enterica TaxID=28901 RepID=A0A3J5QWV2_SALER|nr:hypothetical protein [Salmonella enterica]EBI0348848.1 hypothetical protein [Salmonella enterica subsp. arizonae serovar 48:z4,z23,z32:-]ECU4769202.1 hypothetical protein [Salmonella enterica subsp. enterica]EDQ1017437.1 hypothetical protein [Salmonella enterica subsp. houtenae serovar 50:z4,z23:-]EDV3252458.1 hypothetical protein [Salmonella enterica subsp. houtenae]EDW0440475.1 hypothetical protein [Salmonella enterica subsp. arizonae serovar 50:z4,z23:-]HAE7876137.1 hypothetical protein
MKERGITDGLTMNQLAERNAEHVATIAALVAENAGLKYQEPTLTAMMACLEEFYADEDVPERAMMAAYNILRKSISTPATDAFLAEVRASELDSLAGVAETMLIKFSNQQCSSDMHEVVGWKMVLQQAANRAAQLRKGAAL